MKAYYMIKMKMTEKNENDYVYVCFGSHVNGDADCSDMQMNGFLIPKKEFLEMKQLKKELSHLNRHQAS